MTVSELRKRINHYVETIKLPSRISGYRLNIILNNMLDLISNSGSGISSLPVGNSVFVNVLGDDSVALREREDLPFSSIDSAITTAQSGDTIIVYPGSYSATVGLHKPGVKWKFIGNPTITLSGNAYWSDSAGATDIFIEGDATIVATHQNPILKVENVGTKVNVSFRDVTAPKLPFYLKNGSGVINVSGTVLCTLNSVNFAFYEDSNYTVNADVIRNTATTGSVTACVLGLGWSGYNVVNARIIDQANVSGSGYAIYTYNGAATGTIVVNVSEEVRYSSPVASGSLNKTIFHISGSLIINGNINGGVCSALNMDYASHNKRFEHNGDAYNDGTEPLIVHSASNSAANLNGRYRTSNPEVIKLTGTNKTVVNGIITNVNNSSGTKSGINLTSTNVVLLETLKIVFKFKDSQSFGLLSALPSNVKILHGVSSNADKDTAITNAITGTSYIYDNDVE